jgi:hypothetical protein
MELSQNWPSAATLNNGRDRRIDRQGNIQPEMINGLSRHPRRNPGRSHLSPNEYSTGTLRERMQRFSIDHARSSSCSRGLPDEDSSRRVIPEVWETVQPKKHRRLRTLHQMIDKIPKKIEFFRLTLVQTFVNVEMTSKFDRYLL